MSTANKLQKKFGGNLSESLGVRSAPSAPPPTAGPATVSPDDGRTRAREAGHMEIERIVPDPNQPRKAFDAEALDRLAASLKRHGQLLPVRVRWDAGLAKWVIISGERRYQAAQRAGLKTLACVFVDRPLTDTEILQEQIVENLLREDLKPVEQAKAYDSLMAMNGWNGSQLAEALHISKATVSRVLALLRLPDDIQDQVNAGRIPSTAAYEVAKLPTPAAQQAMAERIVNEVFTRREAVDAVRAEMEPPPAEPEPEFRRETPPPVIPVGQEVTPREFRGETFSPPAAPVGQELSNAGFRGETPIAEGAPGPEAAPDSDAVSLPPAAEATPPNPVRKPGKPRTGTKERSYRVEGARVAVTFLKKVPSPAELVAALEQALEQARREAGGRAAA